MPDSSRKPTKHNGQAIRDYRIKLGLSAGQFADMIGMSQKGLLNIETETRSTKPENLYRIAKALDVSIHAILRDPAVANGNGNGDA